MFEFLFFTAGVAYLWAGVVALDLTERHVDRGVMDAFQNSDLLSFLAVNLWPVTVLVSFVMSFSGSRGHAG